MITTTVLIVSCDTQIGVSDIESALWDIINGDDALSLDGFNDGGANDDDYESGDLNRIVDGDDFTYPIRWGRKNVDATVTVDFEPFQVDSDTIIAVIERNVEGELVVFDVEPNEDTTEVVVVDSSFKDFSMTGQRKIRFVRIDNSDNPRHNWKLEAVTPFIAYSPDSNVEIDSIMVYKSRPTDNDSNDELYFKLENVGDLLNTFLDREDLPHFHPEQFVKVEVALHRNTENEYDERAFLHYGRHHGPKHRKPMFDDGGLIDYWGHTSPDETENDNIHTGLWRMHQTAPDGENHFYRAFFDVLDEESLLAPEGEYHSFVIGFPYIVSTVDQISDEVFKP